MSAQATYKTFQCRTGGYIYDEAEGAPNDGLTPGTRCDQVRFRHDRALVMPSFIVRSNRGRRSSAAKVIAAMAAIIEGAESALFGPYAGSSSLSASTTPRASPPAAS